MTMSSQVIYVVERQLYTRREHREQPRYIPALPQSKEVGMMFDTRHRVVVRSLGLAALALSLGACATYDDEFAGINSRLDQLDTRVQSAAQSAESANQSAQRANQRLDQIEARVQQLNTASGRKPRG